MTTVQAFPVAARAGALWRFERRRWPLVRLVLAVAWVRGG